jgi:hypothetical protein
MKHLYIIIFLFLSFNLFSQHELKEFGVRTGYTNAFTFRVKLEEYLSYEMQAGYRNQGTVFTMFRQQHQELGIDRYGNWDFIYGFGAHAGFYFTDSYRILFRDIHFGRDLFTPVIGFDGYLAIDYHLVKAPVSLGVSFQPFMELSLKQLFGINLWDFGVSARYRF